MLAKHCSTTVLTVGYCDPPGKLRLDNQRTMNTTAGAVQVCTEWAIGSDLIVIHDLLYM